MKLLDLQALQERITAKPLLSALAGLVVVAGLAASVAAAVLIEVVAPPAPRSTQALIVDTDAGADDAFAILSLLRAEQIPNGSSPAAVPHVVAITTVQGNTGAANVTRNVLATLRSAQRLDVRLIPVYAGAENALLPPGPVFTYYFGQDGFGDFLSTEEPIGEVESEAAAVALVRLAKEQPGMLTLICLGPLTNVALAIRLDPGFLGNLHALYILGGTAKGYGNMKPGVEFNVHMDPEAALVVLESIPSDRPAFLMPWETTLDSEIPLAWRRDVLGSAETSAMTFLNLAERVALQQTADAWTCADGMLAAFLLDNRVATLGKAVYMSVLSGLSPGRGVTVVDHGNTTGLPANVVLIEQPDASAFQRLLLRLLAS